MELALLIQAWSHLHCILKRNWTLFTKIFTNASHSKDLNGGELSGDEIFQEIELNDITAANTTWNKGSNKYHHHYFHNQLKGGYRSWKDDLFKEIFETQEDSIAILERLINRADESQVIAEDSLSILQLQREQLERIDRRMEELGTGLKRASRELRSFFRKLATEKIILLSIILITLGILALIIWGLINHFCGDKCKVHMNNNNHVPIPSKNGAKLFVSFLSYK